MPHCLHPAPRVVPACRSLPAVWIVLSGARDVLLEQRFVSILEVILLAVAQHLAYLAFNFAVVW